MAKIKLSVKSYVVIGIIIFLFVPAFAKYAELQYKNKKLAEQMVALKQENLKLEEDKRRLETDVNYIEERARNKIGLVRKGEIVIKSAPSNK